MFCEQRKGEHNEDSFVMIMTLCHSQFMFLLSTKYNEDLEHPVESGAIRWQTSEISVEVKFSIQSVPWNRADNFRVEYTFAADQSLLNLCLSNFSIQIENTKKNEYFVQISYVLRSHRGDCEWTVSKEGYEM